MSHESVSNGTFRGFISHHDAREFWLLCVATFLCFLTLSQTALLSVILSERGVPVESVGIVLASYGVTVTAFSLVSGPLANRIGTLHTLQLGMALLLIAHLSYHFTIGSLTGAITSRLLQGAGFGLFLASAMAFATGKLAPERIVYLLGIYASMVQLPNALGPPLAKLYLDHYGSGFFFLAGALPALLALPLTTGMQDRVVKISHSRNTTLTKTAADPKLRLPLIAILVVGTMLGLVPSYMAPLLIDKEVPIACFFSVYPVTAFVSRFVLMAWIERWPRWQTLCAGFAFMSIAYAGLAATDNALVVIALAILFGLGSSVSYPTLSACVSDLFDAGNKAMPLAVFNTAFNLGLFLTPLSAGYIIAFGGYHLSLLLLAGGSALIALTIIAKRSRIEALT